MTQTAEKPTTDLQERAVNVIRALTIDATQEAGSGHPGMPMGAAAMGYTLFTQSMRYNPRNPLWFDRDRYVQSAGHGSMLQYSLLHLTGFDVSMDDLKAYRQFESKTPGHPEVHHTPGVETTTGPLGQGLATAVGMALAEAHLAAVYNRPDFDIVNHYTFVIASDGDLMEGVTHEASSLAGHLGLGKLIVLYDDNKITLDDDADVSFSEDTLKRYDAYGWHTAFVEDGNDVAAIHAAVEAAKGEQDRPSLIAVRTIIGYGAPDQDTSGVHGSPLGEEDAAKTKETLGIDWPVFTVPDDVLGHYREAVSKGEEAERDWNERFEAYKGAFPELAEQFGRMLSKKLPEGLEDALPHFEGGKSTATRNASGEALNALAKLVPAMLGGSADLAGSTKTDIDDTSIIQRGNYSGRNIYFGVREHAMAAAANGMALHDLRPFVGTFLIFSDYLRPALRLSALMDQPVVYVFTHDSIGLGGDGPTHQPVAALMALRAIPNMTVIRPADANETAQAWAYALRHQDGPVALALTRQNVPNLEVPKGSVAKGAYIAAEARTDGGGAPDLILIGTGSEVHKCLEAKEVLEGDGVKTRVVSMASFEIFNAQDENYRESVLPKGVRARVAVEAGSLLGWGDYVGLDGAVVGLDRFGASGEGDVVMEKLGFNTPHIVETAKRVLSGLSRA